MNKSAPDIAVVFTDGGKKVTLSLKIGDAIAKYEGQNVTGLTFQAAADWARSVSDKEEEIGKLVRSARTSWKAWLGGGF